MKIYNLLLISLISLVFACKNQDVKEITSNQDNKMLTAEITGMTCEQGCGGAIRKNLKAAGGVSKVEYDFVMDAEKQICRVYFDANKISEEKISQIVSTINEEQFEIKVLNVQDVAKK